MGKYIRHKIIQEEIVDANRATLPASIKRQAGNIWINQQVNVGEWVVSYQNGTKEVFSDKEFIAIFKPIEDQPTKPAEHKDEPIKQRSTSTPTQVPGKGQRG